MTNKEKIEDIKTETQLSDEIYNLCLDYGKGNLLEQEMSDISEGIARKFMIKLQERYKI